MNPAIDLYSAAMSGTLERVSEILKAHPAVDVNWAGDMFSGTTALHEACQWDFDVIVSLLLDHPAIDVNVKDAAGNTAIWLACVNGAANSLKVLLKDPRVVINHPNRAPLKQAVQEGNVYILKCLVVSGRDIGSVPDAVRMCRDTVAVTFLTRFQANPGQVVARTRKELGYVDKVAQVFALVIFLSDGLLAIRRNLVGLTRTTRFLAIASLLPLDLQAVLCCRLGESMRNSVKREDSEAAFLELAKFTRYA